MVCCLPLRRTAGTIDCDSKWHSLCPLQIFGCSPDQLGPGIRAELEAVLRESAGLIEASIRWVLRNICGAAEKLGAAARKLDAAVQGRLDAVPALHPSTSLTHTTPTLPHPPWPAGPAAPT